MKDVRPFLEAHCVDILQPDISHVGGISELKRIAAMCEAYDVGKYTGHSADQ
jgi:galactonate dehydratase